MFESLSWREWNEKIIPLFESLSERNEMEYSFLHILSKLQIFISLNWEE